jgi:hypothetical protein
MMVGVGVRMVRGGGAEGEVKGGAGGDVKPEKSWRISKHATGSAELSDPLITW